MATFEDVCKDQYLFDLAQSLGLSGASAHFVPGREETKVPLPARLRIGPARKWINKDPRFEGGVRLHHGKANELWEAGHNIIQTAGTNAGKSLVFMLEALHIIMSDPNATVIALYPTQALNNDQRGKWKEGVTLAGLPEETVGIIDGTVLWAERPPIMKKARILITTPDSLDGALLGNLHLEENRNFLARLRLKIVDEAHLLSGALGSNMIYVFRNLDAVQQSLNPDFSPAKHSRYIAASATIDRPQQFMKKLTGRDFAEVGEEFNGARTYPKLIVALPGASVDYLTGKVLKAVSDNQLLVFRNSRPDVEELASSYSNDLIPFKSGMSAQFRQYAERTIRDKSKRGVAATSALEVGVDLAFDTVLNDGVPRNTGQAWQRIGRAGRRGPGLVIFTDNDGILDEHDGDVARYLATPPTPQILYADNEFIQLAQALRLLDQNRKIRENVTGGRLKMTGISWPRHFNEALDLAKTNSSAWPLHLRTVSPPQGTSPHRFNGIRSVGGESWRLGQWQKVTKRYEDLGSTNSVNAFTEYAPGAIVRHQGRRWRVQRWTRNDRSMIVDMRQLRKGEIDSSTHHVNVKYGQADGTPEHGLMGRYVRVDTLKLDKGIGDIFVGEVRFRLQQGLSHFIETYKTKEGEYRKKRLSFHDDEEIAGLKAEEMKGDIHDYGPRRRLVINTTGVVIHMQNAQFGQEKRRNVADAIIREYCAAYNLSRSDLGFQETVTRFVAPDGTTRDIGNLVIHDRTAGSLRLTQHLVSALPTMIKRAVAVHRARLNKKIEEFEAKGASDGKPPRDEALEDLVWLQERLDRTKLIAKDRLLSALPPKPEKTDAQAPVLPEGYISVIPPGTRVDWMRNGLAQRIRVLEPVIKEGALYYEVFAVNRSAFFGKARALHFERLADEGVIFEEKPRFAVADAEKKVFEVTRLIPATELVMDARKTVGFNPETGEYLSVNDTGAVQDISGAMEDRIEAYRQKQAAQSTGFEDKPSPGG